MTTIMKKLSTSQDLITAIRQLLDSGHVSTQADIIAALLPLGFAVNQSKVSRLLHKIGAVKIVAPDGEITYQLPREPAPLPTKSPLASLISIIKHNENMIVIKTVPGAASLIARLLDHNAEKCQILGSVAGDDTILLAPTVTKEIQQTIENIKRLLSDIN